MCPPRLAVVTTHPVQYYAPLFRQLAKRGEVEPRVFYGWRGAAGSAALDRGFGASFEWDVPLLDGYAHTFVENVAADPGTHHFRGIDTPGLVPAIEAWGADAVLVFGWNYKAHPPNAARLQRPRPRPVPRRLDALGRAGRALGARAVSRSAAGAALGVRPRRPRPLRRPAQPRVLPGPRPRRAPAVVGAARRRQRPVRRSRRRPPRPRRATGAARSGSPTTTGPRCSWASWKKRKHRTCC